MRHSGLLMLGGEWKHRRVAVVARGGPAHGECTLFTATSEQRAAPQTEAPERVPNPGQEHGVPPEPHQPAGESAQADAFELDDGAEPTDRRHAAEVDVLERLDGVIAPEPAPDRAAGEQAL